MATTQRTDDPHDGICSTLHVQKETVLCAPRFVFLPLLCTPVPLSGASVHFRSGMEALAEAATATSQAAENESAKPPEATSGKKRGRGSNLESAEKKLLDLFSKRAIAVATVEQKKGQASQKARDKEALATAEKRVRGFDAAILAAEENVKEMKAAAAAVAQSKAAKAAAALAKEEVTKSLSEAGTIVLCQLRGKYAKQMDNTSDKVDSVWAHIHRDFMKEVTKGELPTSDGRSAAALQKRFATELGEFRLWCAVANRAVHYSGVPADKVEEEVKAHFRPTTTILRKLGFEVKPMSVPPWSINGDSASDGGMGNGLSGGSGGGGSGGGGGDKSCAGGSATAADETAAEDASEDYGEEGTAGFDFDEPDPYAGSGWEDHATRSARTAKDPAFTSPRNAGGSSKATPSPPSVPEIKPLHIGGSTGSSGGGGKKAASVASALGDFTAVRIAAAPPPAPLPSCSEI